MDSTKVLSAQGILAKLLATENITVHVGNYKTAFFDPKNRILGLPSWHVQSKAMSDLFIGHEVGHALWSENAHIERFRLETPHIPFDIYNVVEDVRIERMIQSRFPGLISAFAQGYTELCANDFFGIAKKNVAELNFTDRLNIKAKAGHLVNVPMDDAELAIFKRCTEAQTFEDVHQLCKDVYAMILAARKKADEEAKAKAVPKPSKKSPSPMSEPEPGGLDGQGESESDDDGGEAEEDAEVVVAKKPAPAKKEEEKKEDDKTNDTGDSAPENDDKDDEPEEGVSSGLDWARSEKDDSDDDIASCGAGEGEDGDAKDKTGDADDDAADDFSFTPSEAGEDDKSDDDTFTPSANNEGVKTPPKKDAVYKAPEEELRSATMEAAQENLNKLQANLGTTVPVIMPTKSQLDEMVVPVAAVLKSRMENPTYNRLFTSNTEVHSDWVSYKKKTKKQIQPLVSEFERRKAAFQYSRSRVSDSGEIDVNRLHSYKFNDEIFRSVTKMADAKNHGMIFLIDYSASMSSDIFNVIDQTLNIVMFCQTVGIPFQVFGFSSFYGNKHLEDTSCCRKYFESGDFLSNQIDMSTVNVFELISSDQKKPDQELAMRHLRAAVFYNTEAGRSYASYAERCDIPFKSRWEIMMSTPLLESLIIMHRVVEKFKARHHVQRMTLMVLTDGSPDSLRLGDDSGIDEFIKAGDRYFSRKLTSKFYGRELNLVTGSYMDRSAGVRNYATLVESLKTAMGCTMIGFFINANRSALKKSAIASIMESASIPNGKSWNAAETLLKSQLKTDAKTKCTFIKGGFNYDCYFVIESADTRIDSEEDFNSSIDDDEFTGEIKTVTKNKLAKEFNKFTSAKRTSRMILTKFAELVS